MVGCGNNDRVNILLSFQHDPEIPILFGVGERVIHLGGASVIDIAKGDNVGNFAGLAISQIFYGHTAGGDTGDIHFFTGRDLARSSQNMPRYNKKSGGSGRTGLEKSSARQRFFCLPFHTFSLSLIFPMVMQTPFILWS